MTLGRCPWSIFCSRGTHRRKSVEPTNPESITNHRKRKILVTNDRVAEQESDDDRSRARRPRRVPPPPPHSPPPQAYYALVTGRLVSPKSLHQFAGLRPFMPTSLHTALTPPLPHVGQESDDNRGRARRPRRVPPPPPLGLLLLLLLRLLDGQRALGDCAAHGTPLHPTPYTLHPTHYTLHPYTLHPTSYTLHPYTPTPIHPTPYTLHPTLCGRANMAHVRQSRPVYGLGFQIKVPQTFQVVPSSPWPMVCYP